MPIIKRKSNREKLIYTVDGVLVVKTPAECTNWPQAFRLRLVKNYVPPRTMMTAPAYEQQFVKTGSQSTVYVVGLSKKKAMVLQPVQHVNDKQLVILRTEVIDVDAGKAMYLYHEDAAMRVLMTYAFLTGAKIPGLPELEVYDHKP